MGQLGLALLIAGFLSSWPATSCSCALDRDMRMVVTLGDLVGRIERLEVRCTGATGRAG